MKRLIEIQKTLKVPKEQVNTFGGYKFRNCEDILEAVKPLLAEQKLLILLNDEIVFVEGRFYVKATATIFDEEGKEITHTTAYAREEESKPKMDGSQVTGSSSSYARKYALNGLFAIDDNKDSDTTNTHGKISHPNGEGNKKKQEDKFIPDVIKKQQADDIDILEGVANLNTEDECTDYWNKNVPKLSGAEARKQLAELLKQRREKINE